MNALYYITCMEHIYMTNDIYKKFNIDEEYRINVLRNVFDSYTMLDFNTSLKYCTNLHVKKTLDYLININEILKYVCG